MANTFSFISIGFYIKYKCKSSLKSLERSISISNSFKILFKFDGNAHYGLNCRGDRYITQYWLNRKIPWIDKIIKVEGLLLSSINIPYLKKKKESYESSVDETLSPCDLNLRRKKFFKHAVPRRSNIRFIQTFILCQGYQTVVPMSATCPVWFVGFV